MIVCPICQEGVVYHLLRQPQPRCEKDHVLGRWVKCGNPEGGHIYLHPLQGDVCPICGDGQQRSLQMGEPVLCLHKSKEGKPCLSPRYRWLIDGPPCYMNHLDIIIEDKSSP